MSGILKLSAVETVESLVKEALGSDLAAAGAARRRAARTARRVNGILTDLIELITQE